jgi:hypothetical protein
MQFVAVTYVAHNVQCLPKAREPTVRAAKGFPPPLPSIHFHRPRWQGAERRRGKRMLADVGALHQRDPLHHAVLVIPRPCSQAAATRRQPLTTHQLFVRAHFRQRFTLADGPRADRQGGGGLSTAFHLRPISSPAGASGRRPRRGKSVLADADSAGSLARHFPDDTTFRDTER